MSPLLERHCVSCDSFDAPLAQGQVEELATQLTSHWNVVEGRRLRRTFEFGSFDEVMMFVNDIAALAESEGHHPDLHVSFKHVTVELTTHALGGLTDNDFILARKIEVCC